MYVGSDGGLRLGICMSGRTSQSRKDLEHLSIFTRKRVSIYMNLALTQKFILTRQLVDAEHAAAVYYDSHFVPNSNNTYK